MEILMKKKERRKCRAAKIWSPLDGKINVIFWWKKKRNMQPRWQMAIRDEEEKNIHWLWTRCNFHKNGIPAGGYGTQIWTNKITKKRKEMNCKCKRSTNLIAVWQINFLLPFPPPRTLIHCPSDSLISSALWVTAGRVLLLMADQLVLLLR